MKIIKLTTEYRHTKPAQQTIATGGINEISIIAQTPSGSTIRLTLDPQTAHSLIDNLTQTIIDLKDAPVLQSSKQAYHINTANTQTTLSATIF